MKPSDKDIKAPGPGTVDAESPGLSASITDDGTPHRPIRSFSRGGIFFKVGGLFFVTAVLTTLLFSGSSYLLFNYLLKHEVLNLEERVTDLADRVINSERPLQTLRQEAGKLDFKIAVYRNNRLIFSNHEGPRDPRRIFQRRDNFQKRLSERNGGNRGKFTPDGNFPDTPRHDNPNAIIPGRKIPGLSDSQQQAPPRINPRPFVNRINQDDLDQFSMNSGPPDIPPHEFLGMPMHGPGSPDDPQMENRPDDADQGPEEHVFKGLKGRWVMDRKRNMVFTRFTFGDLTVITGQRPKHGPRDFLIRIVIGTGSIILAGLAAVLVLVNRLLMPIDAMMEGTRQMSSGNLDYRIPSKGGNDQFSFLINAFNHMAGRLSNMFSNNLLIMGNISHDLKYYLTRLRMTAEVEIDDQELQRSIMEDLDLMTDYIDRAISAYRIGSRKIGLQYSEFNLSELLMDRMSQHGVPVRNNGTLADNVMITADRTYLGNVLDNIMENARKYGSNSAAELDLSGDSFRLIISNDIGKPMVRKELPLLFEPFYRGDRARAQNNPGSGLGLFISRQACESMDISMEAELESNTRFMIVLRGKVGARVHQS